MKLPDLERPIRLVGLTGSMGTGKSSAAKAFAALSVPVDAGMRRDECVF